MARPAQSLNITGSLVHRSKTLQGRPPIPSPKNLSILDAKNEPFKNLPCTCLSKPLSSLAVMKLMNKCQTIERFRIFHFLRPRLNEAGEAWPRPRRGVLAQRQSEAHGDSKVYNTIVGVPAGLNST